MNKNDEKEEVKDENGINALMALDASIKKYRSHLDKEEQPVGVKEIYSAMPALSGMANDLRQLVKRFKI